LFLGYCSLKVSDSGWAERLGGQGIYWILIYLGNVNQWWQYNNLKVFLIFFVMWLIVLIFLFVYLNILCRVRHWRCRWGFDAFKCIYEILFIFTVKV
jgi:hypothetical protein